MRLSILTLLSTAAIALAFPAAVEVDKRAIECPSRAAANTACTAGRPAFSCGGSYVRVFAVVGGKVEHENANFMASTITTRKQPVRWFVNVFVIRGGKSSAIGGGGLRWDDKEVGWRGEFCLYLSR